LGKFSEGAESAVSEDLLLVGGGVEEQGGVVGEDGVVDLVGEFGADDPTLLTTDHAPPGTLLH
jgi:hypothetical protein